MSRGLTEERSVEAPEFAQDPREFFYTLIARLPGAAVTRSTLKKIEFFKPHWFCRDTEVPTATDEVSKAISPTAIIPSKTDYSDWQKHRPASNIWMYQIKGLDEDVRTIVHAQAFIHELVHTLTAPAIYADHRLRLPNNIVVSSLEFMTEFAKEAQKLPPITHYSSGYRNPDGSFKNNGPQGYQIAISEEMCESAAAQLLGFAFTLNPQTRFEPLSDRLELRKQVYQFLNARREK